MRSPRLSLKRSLLLSAFFAAAIFSTTGFAQDDDESTPPAPARPSSTPTARTSTTRTTPQSQPTRESTTDTERPPAIGQTTTTSAATPTTPADTDSELPPALTRTYFGGLPPPTYPPAGIPPTYNAPFMNHSTLPDGTVFIVVGAILGTFALAIMIWRGIVACLLHRSVERAAMAQHVDASKSPASFPAPPAPFYKFTDRDSSPSLASGGLGAAGAGARNNRKSHRGPTPSSTPSQTNLFFSPTAAPGTNALGNRDSRFLPSGFYASASPAGPLGTSLGHGNSISLSNLRPVSMGFSGVPSHSPPDSPNVRAQSRNLSSTSLNMNRPPSGRAPSAFLEDLLDDPAYEGQFPTGQPGQSPPQAFGPNQGYGQGGHPRFI
ncbi:vacuolar membrane protein [Rhypophila sp. PSN 637]